MLGPMKFGPHEVIAELGRGGMGIVYKARSPDGRELAIKLLSEVEPEFRDRFARERTLLETLGLEEGFVPLVDAGDSPRGPWIAMPFVPGGTLGARIQRGMSCEETASLGLALATALGKAHARGIVHRDMKPDNVLLTEDGRPLITDLGLAKHFDRGAHALTLTGTAMGSPGYMSPEQIEDVKKCGPATDVFALGVILYECLAREHPFPFLDFEDYRARIARREPPRPLRLVRKDVPAKLEAVIARALALDLTERFPDGIAMARALKERPAASRSVGLVLGGALLLVGGGVALALASRDPAALPPPPRTSPPPPKAPAVPKAPTSEELVASAHAKLERRDLEGAASDARRATELDAKNARAWDARSEIANERQEREDALAFAERAIELDPGVARFYLHRSAARVSVGDLQGTIDDAQKATELDPRDAVAWGTLAGALRYVRRYDEMIVAGTRAIELDPSLHGAFNQRGFARANKGDLEGARSDLERALALNPGAEGYMVDLGSVLNALGRFEDASPVFRRAAATAPAYPEVWEGLGLARFRLGDWDGAIEGFEKFLALAPGREEAAQIRDLLAQAKARRGH
jgi:serine/threonine-protein kinase